MSEEAEPKREHDGSQVQVQDMASSSTDHAAMLGGAPLVSSVRGSWLVAGEITSKETSREPWSLGSR